MQQIKSCFLVSLFTLCCSFSLFAENKPGIVYAPNNQKVVIKAEADANSKDLAILADGHFFYYKPTQDISWAKIQVYGRENFTEGYIPKNNMLLIDSLTDIQQRKIISEVLTTHKLLAEELQKSVNMTLEENMAARKKIEEHSWAKYNYALDMIPAYIESTADNDLLQLLIETIYTNKGSANELPSTTIAKCYVAQPDLTISLLNKITNKEKQTYFINQMEWGISNYYHYQKDDLDNQRDSLLEKLKRSVK